MYILMWPITSVNKLICAEKSPLGFEWPMFWLGRMCGCMVLSMHWIELPLFVNGQFVAPWVPWYLIVSFTNPWLTLWMKLFAGTTEVCLASVTVAWESFEMWSFGWRLWRQLVWCRKFFLVLSNWQTVTFQGCWKLLKVKSFDFEWCV